MPFNPQNFVDPAQFGDYSYYMGVKPTDQMQSVSEAAGIKPPESVGDYVSQAVQPLQNKFNAVTGAAESLAQGNVGQAFKTYKGVPTPAQPSVPQAGDGFDHNW